MLENLYLENFKAFRTANIPLRQLTLLSGLNGSGKSTVLQALAVLRQSNEGGFTVHEQLSLNGPLVELGSYRDVLFHNFDGALQSSIGYKSSRNGEERVWKFFGSSDDDVVDCDPAGFDTWSSRPTDEVFSGQFHFLRADRITPSVTFPRAHHTRRDRGHLGSRGEFTPQFLLDFSYKQVHQSLLHPDEREATSLVSQVNAWLQEFSPGVRVEPMAVEMTELVRLEYSYKGDGASYGDPIRPTNVGFGLTHVLPIVTACLGVDRDSILIVENPEAQLHPKGQVAIGRLLALTAASGVQVFIETHSDHILNGIRLAVKQTEILASQVALHFFSRHPSEGATYESPSLDESGRLSYWPVGFFDQFESSLDQLLG